MIVLPRQARDKHRENSKKSAGIFLQVDATAISSDIVWQDEKWLSRIPWGGEPSHFDIPAGSIWIFFAPF